jgi:uncharacterized membrane protein
MSAFRHWSLLALLLVPPAAWGQAAPSVAAASPAAVVHAVLFYSPTCPHCHKVMTVDLPPLVQRYGTQLQIATVNVTTAGGQALYQATVAHFALPDSRLGVPALVVGSRVLVGSQEIPDELPGLVDRGLAAGGIGWPDVPEIRQAVAQTEQAARREAARQQIVAAESARVAGDAAPRPAAAAARAEAPTTIPAPAAAATRADTPASAPRDTAANKQAAPENAGTGGRVPTAPPAPAHPAGTPPPAVERGAPTPGDTGRAITAMTSISGDPPSGATARMGAWERFRLDPVGNSAALAVLLAMVAALTLVCLALLGRRVPLPAAPSWVVPVLCVAGLGVASYLAVVEVTGARAVCGPVGDCNTVQQSEYARLFGVLPVGVLGMVGYVGMVGSWLLGLLGRGSVARAGRLGAWGAALVATAFSVYLTFLEPFVIGATCAWCLSSALIATLLLLLLTPAARQDLPALGAQEGRGAA